MVKKKTLIFVALIIFFLGFSFYPTYFELQKSHSLADSTHREFILEHNYYWPDYNLYLSKIRQGMEGRILAIERYTSEPHSGSLIQIFYVALGWLGRLFSLTPNNAYLLARIGLSLGLLCIISKLMMYYFERFVWQALGFVITVVSGSFPYLYSENGITKISRYMEWWSNIDALQRITFIPHILFGQIFSFILFLHLSNTQKKISKQKLIMLILGGNVLGIIFPPSLITLLAAFSFLSGIDIYKRWKKSGFQIFLITEYTLSLIYFVIGSLPSLFYTLALTKNEPWATLVSVHRNNHFIIPFQQFIFATGPIFYLALAGMIVLTLQRFKKYYSLIFWCFSTFIFLIFYTYVKDQSPLRFTQTGLFIPLGILGTYFLYFIWNLVMNMKYKVSQIKYIFVVCSMLFVICYIVGSLFMMKNSLDWQTSWISQRIGATVPLVPYPPQAMYPLKDWMAAIRWLNNNTPADSVVLSEVTAGNYIPGYSHNIVYFGQANTVQYDRKQAEATKFFSGLLTQSEAMNLFQRGHISYIFFSIQEKDDAKGKELLTMYPFLKEVYKNQVVSIYSVH